MTSPENSAESGSHQLKSLNSYRKAAGYRQKSTVEGGTSNDSQERIFDGTEVRQDVRDTESTSSHSNAV
ncbi:hypothetical protein RUND412_002399 [Rhizina undulata]